MGKPRLLDLFAGSGGAAFGYYLAGFSVFGVDNDPKPLRHYPFPHVCADALEYLAEHGREYDAIHASPPCQGYSIMHNLPWLKGREYPLLILPTMELLEATGKPYVLENVMGARHGAKGLKKRGLEAHGLKAGWLCGGMFGLPFYRHRLFATNWFWLAPGHPKHRGTILKGRNLGDRGHMVAHSLSNWQNGAEGVGIGHAKGWKLAAEAMEIDWPVTWAELTQMIPPVYTRFMGNGLMEEVRRTKATLLGFCLELSGQQPEAKSLCSGQGGLGLNRDGMVG